VSNGPGRTSAAALAELARAGSAIARQSIMQVNFEVHHIADRAGYLRDQLHGRLEQDEEASPAHPMLRETLSSAANGIGLVIGTYPGTLPPALKDRRQGSSLPVALKVDDEEGARIFRGTIWPSPSFIHERARVLEGLISVDDEPRPLSHKHGSAIGELLQQLSTVAAQDAGAPILLMQCPVQLPPHRFVDTKVQSRKVDWPRFSAIAVRFAMALQRSSAEHRLDLTDRLSQFCAERGYGLWLRDSRLGHRSGNWFQIRVHDRPAARRSFERWSRKSTSGGPSCCLPVTLVGPARVGASQSIMSFLREFTHLGVLACSVTSLDDLAFIHLQLAINDIGPTKLAPFQQAIESKIESAAAVSEPQARTSPPQRLLPEILPLLVGDPEASASHKALADLTRWAGDYQVLAGPAMPTRNVGTHKRKALWFSWQAEATHTGLAAPLVAFVDAVRSSGLVPIGDGDEPAAAGEPNIEYLVCRDVGDSTLRARGKISLPVELLTWGSGTELESDGPRVCANLEDAWRTELEQHSLPGVADLSVAWLEHRLGHQATTF
jgi:hypothetical protein